MRLRRASPMARERGRKVQPWGANTRTMTSAERREKAKIQPASYTCSTLKSFPSHAKWRAENPTPLISWPFVNAIWELQLLQKLSDPNQRSSTEFVGQMG